MDDRFTESGAGVLARKIERHWKAKGHPNVKAWVEKSGGGLLNVPIFVVRSNLINGLPPKVAMQALAA